MKTTFHALILITATMAIAACGTKKAALSGNVQQPKTETATTANAAEMRRIAFVQTVSDRRLYQKNIVGNMSFSIKSGALDHTLPGSIHMRKDEVIRLQILIPFIGSEIARLEFTPEYVLVIDRIHKEYIKADYNQLDFLRENGLNFYALQAFFWNELLLPGQKKVAEADLTKFSADMEKQEKTVPVTLQNGKMSYQWNADRQSGQILSAVATYLSDTHGKSQLTWQYADFKPLGVKQFPASQTFSFSTNATKQPRTVTVAIGLDDISTDSKWDSHSSVSEKYRKVDAKEALGKILKL